MVLMKGRIITIDDAHRIAEAVAIKDGRIVAVGSNREIEGLIGEGTRVIDLGGKPLLPGFIDTHTHPSHAAMRLYEIDLRSPPVKSIEDILRLVAEKAEELGPDKWVRGTNYNEAKLIERRHVTRWELDEAAPKNPVFITKETGHEFIANSRALEIAGISRERADPPGGRIDRRKDGEPTGVLYETAGRLVLEHIPPYTVEEVKEGLRRVWDQLAEWGITTTHDAGVDATALRAYQELLAEGIRKVRTLVMVKAQGSRGEDLLGALVNLGIESGFGDEWLRIMGVKIMGDGSGAGGTAAVYEPQHRGPGGLGIMVTPPEELKRLVIKAHRAGLRVCIHSIGDRAIDYALDAIEEAQRETPKPDVRHRIEHNSLCTPRQLKRIKELGVTPSSSIGYMWRLGDNYQENFGPERARWLHPHRSMLEMGIIAGGNSDYPVSDGNPLIQIYEAVTRRTSSGLVIGSEEAIGVMEAIRVYTWNGAYLGKEEHLKGSIEPGKLADLVVLDRDPLSTPVEEIKEIKEMMTIVGGEIVYQRNG
jgi:hypothetical protein